MSNNAIGFVKRIIITINNANGRQQFVLSVPGTNDICDPNVTVKRFIIDEKTVNENL